MIKTKKVLILGASEIQIPIINKANSMGLFTIVVDQNLHAPGFKLANKSLQISTLDTDLILEAAISEQIDAILTTSDLPVNVVAFVSEKLNLCSMTTENAMLCTDKFLQRNFLNKFNFNTPFYSLCKTDSEFEKIIDFPVVMKPVDSSGSRGVIKINSMSELKTNYSSTVKYSIKKQIIIEQFISGREFSVEALTQNGKTKIVAITEKFLLGEEDGFFVEDAHIIPARLTSLEHELISNVVLSAIEKMKLNNTASHTEVKINQHGVYIIEIACRLGGDFITSDLVPIATGIDMLSSLINISLGNTIDISPKNLGYATIQFINNKNYTEGLKYIEENSKNIIKYEVKPFNNTTVKSSFDRLGYIIFKTNTDIEAVDILNKINTYKDVKN